MCYFLQIIFDNIWTKFRKPVLSSKHNPISFKFTRKTSCHQINNVAPNSPTCITKQIQRSQQSNQHVPAEINPLNTIKSYSYPCAQIDLFAGQSTIKGYEQWSRPKSGWKLSRKSILGIFIAKSSVMPIYCGDAWYAKLMLGYKM